MPVAEKVVSIDVARRQREVLVPPVPKPDALERKIALMAPKYVSPGATLLLLHIAIYLAEAEADLSASFLCAQLHVTPKTLRKYTEELEDNHFLKVRRSRISKRQNEVTQFEIDFNGAAGGVRRDRRTCTVIAPSFRCRCPRSPPEGCRPNGWSVWFRQSVRP